MGQSMAFWLSVRSVGLALPVVVAIVGLAACGDSTDATLRVAKLAQGCARNSNCDEPLVCTFERCHEECAEDRDCPDKQRCVRGDSGNVCQLPEETGCKKKSDCPGEQVCGVDGECRDSCKTGVSECTEGQLCAMSLECASTDAKKDRVDAEGRIQPEASDPSSVAQGTGTDDKAEAEAGAEAGAEAKAPGEPCPLVDLADEMVDCDETATEEVEPNDTRAEATPICIGTDVTGLSDSNEIDSYAIKMPAAAYGGILTLTWSGTDSSINFRVYNSEEAKQLGSSYSNAQGKASAWLATAPNATYIIELSGYGGYSLSTSWKGTRDCYEPNDDRESAKRIPLGKVVHALMHAAYLDTGKQSPDDWYLVTLEASQTTFKFENVPEGVYLYMELIDSASNRVAGANSTSSGGSFTHDYMAKVAGEYRVKITPSSSPTVFGDELPPAKHTTTWYEMTITQPD